MRNLIVGMRTVNETQIEFNDFSHKYSPSVDYAGEDEGVDRWRAVDGDYKVINVQPLSTTGFANTIYVIPIDSNGNHEVCNTPEKGPGLYTLSFAHDNKVRYKKGDVIKKGEDIAFEGTAGKATGNHLDVQMAEGRIDYKVKNDQGQYIMPNAIRPSHNLFLLKGYNVIKQDLGLPYTWVYSINTEEDTNTLPDLEFVNTDGGSSNLRNVPCGIFAWAKKGSKPKVDYITKTLSNGTILHAMKVERSENVVVSPAYNENPTGVYNLRNRWFEQNGYDLICGCNTSYFKDGLANPTYGLLTGGLLLDWSKVWSKYKTTDLVPNKGKGYPTLWSDGYDMHCNDEWLSPFFSDKVKNGSLYWAMSVGQSNFINGEPNNSVGSENGRANNLETKATIGWCKDGSFVILLFCKKGLTLLSRQNLVKDLVKEWNIDSLFDCDGNGSTFGIFNRSYVNKEEPEPPVDPNPPVYPNQNLTKVTTTKVGLYIRDKIGGSIIGFVPANTTKEFNFIELIPNIQADGYQHAKVNGSWSYKGKTYTNADGYIQLDTTVYYLS